MDLIAQIEAVATILWCYAGVLLVAWVRAVRREELQSHVGHFVSLMGVLVPVVSGFLLVIFLGRIVGIPQVVVALAVLVPGGLTVALQLEVSRLNDGSDRRIELHRLTLVLTLAALVIWWRQVR